jgi:ABC-type uncharacterized transport system substrate-binding protein
MKKYFILALSLLLVLSLTVTGCASQSAPAGNSAPQEKVYKVGLIQLVEHPSLDM